MAVRQSAQGADASASIEVDVLIVGARVAGSVLAALLGEQGWSVLVVDRATFPSGTLSTHFFRGSGCAGVLQTLGVVDEVLKHGSPKLTREYNADALTGEATIDPPQDPGDVGYNLSVRRETLDAILVERARREPSVEVREATPHTTLIRDGDRIVGGTIEGDGDSQDVHARVVVGADGHGSRIARAVEAPIQEAVPAYRAMYYRYAAGWAAPEGDPDGPEFSLGDDELIYVFPSDEGVACVAVSVNLGDYARMRTDAESVFHERLAAHPFLAERAARATWEGRLWACGPRPSEIRVPAGPGWALVGDASMYLDPWTGEGMDNASVHAAFLAEAVGDVLAGRSPEAEAWETYHRRRDEHAIEGFRENARLGADLNGSRSA